GVRAQLPGWSVECSGRFETTLGETRTASGDRLEALVYSGTLAPCADLGQFAGCALLRFGALQARAPDVVQPTLDAALFGAAGVPAAYSLPLGRPFGLRAAVEAGVPFFRVTLNIDRSAVWTSPPAF